MKIRRHEMRKRNFKEDVNVKNWGMPLHHMFKLFAFIYKEAFRGTKLHSEEKRDA